MTFSFRTLGLAWLGAAGSAAAAAVVLQASYSAPAPLPVPAAAPAVVAQTVTQPVPVQPTALPAPAIASVPFQNRSLLAMLPPPDHRLRVAEALPVPPVPPATRVARVEPHRDARVYASAPAQPVYPDYGWGQRLPYPGQYATGRSYYPVQPGYYGWPGQY